MIDLQNDKELTKLRESAKSPNGRYIINYLRQKKAEFDCNKINTEGKTLEEIGMQHEVFRKINDYLETVLSVMDGTLK